MNPQVPDELISAYFDGEVTPEERAAVERLLADSDDAQRDLNETARLSALLHSFPRESAPGTLVGNILRQTSQRPLPVKPAVETPAAVAPAPVQPAPLNSHRNLSRDLAVALASAMFTAAIFLIAIHAMPDARPDAVTTNNRLSPQAPLPTLTQPEPAPAAMAPEQALAQSQHLPPGVRDLSQTPPPPGPVPFKAGRSATSEASIEGLQDMVAQKPSEGNADGARLEEMSEDPDLQITNFQNPLSNGEFKKELRDNNRFYNFVPQVADPDTEVPVVDVAVIDLDKGVEEFLVLLETLEIRRRSADEAGDKRSQEKRQSGRNEEETTAVLVEATGDRLADALNKVDEHPDLYAGWSAQLPLSLASNDSNRAIPNAEPAFSPSKPAGAVDVTAELPDVNRAVEALVTRNGSIQNNSLGTNSIVPLEVGAGRGRATVANTDAPRLNRRFADKDGRQVAAQSGNSKSVAASGYQVVTLPNTPQGINRGAIPGAVDNSSLPRTSFSAGAAKADEKPAARNESSGRALRMLFVLHPQSEAPQPAPTATGPVNP